MMIFYDVNLFSHHISSSSRYATMSSKSHPRCTLAFIHTMLLVIKVGIFGVLALSMMLSFLGMLLLDPYDRSDMCHRLVGMFAEEE